MAGASATEWSLALSASTVLGTVRLEELTAQCRRKSWTPAATLKVDGSVFALRSCLSLVPEAELLKEKCGQEVNWGGD